MSTRGKPSGHRRRPFGAPGVRRYRVWWLNGRAEAIQVRRSADVRLRRYAFRLALGIAALCGAVSALQPAHVFWQWSGLGAVACALALGRWLWRRQRPLRLRRQGARPGPKVWAIDAAAAACTARIRANADVAPP
jgi:hypothetical protein